MLMPDVTEILDDPEVGGGVSFQVRRKTTRRVRGNVETTERNFTATGNIQPQSKGNQPSTVEDQQNESIVVYSTFTFQNGVNNGTSIFTQTDEILYRGKVYRVTHVDDWSEWGYTRAYATHDMG